MNKGDNERNQKATKNVTKKKCKKDNKSQKNTTKKIMVKTNTVGVTNFSRQNFQVNSLIFGQPQLLKRVKMYNCL